MSKLRQPTTPLRERMRQDLRLRNYSPYTIDAYLRNVAQFALHFGVSPDRLESEHIRTYQLFLIEKKKASWNTFIQAVCALRFFYGQTLRQPGMVDYIPYPRKPRFLPVVLAREEVSALIRAPHNLKHRAILATLYTTGLRVSELCNLKGTDIDSGRMVIQVRQGKGKRDRFVGLSPDLLPLLRFYWKRYGLQSWLFPGNRLTHPISRVGVSHACKKAGKAAQINKVIYPHLLRHSCATHLLEAGMDLRSIQLLLGHATLRSTSLYLHVVNPALKTAPSPLDALALPSGLEQLS